MLESKVMIVTALLAMLALSLGSPQVCAAQLVGEKKPSNQDQVMPAAAQVLERYVEAVGGRAALETLTTRECRGRRVTDLSWTQPRVQTVSFEAWTMVPDRFCLRTEENGSVTIEGYDGIEGWKRAGDTTVSAPDVGRSQLAWLLNPQNALRLPEYFPDLEVTGIRFCGDRRCWVLESPNLDTAYCSLHFDMKTGLLVRIGYYWDMEDFRAVDGVMFPHRVVASRKGGSSTHCFDEVKHNVAIDESRFRRPGS